ncbi:MAG: dihydrofolate reductase family protein [Dehalococcoidia bacterium]
MGKIIYSMNLSLDGFIEGPDGRFDWSEPDEELHRHFNEREAHTGYHLFGRRMYELMNGFWPTADQLPDAPDYIAEYARLYRAVPNIVFSRTLQSVDENSRLVRENIAEEVASLKASTDKELALGGPGIAAEFTRLGLVDEYWLYYVPAIVGGGKPMFGGVDQPMRMEMLGVDTFGGGTTLVRCRPLPAAPSE